MAEGEEWVPRVPRLRISAMRMSVKRGSAERWKARNGFRVFRASVFPRCECPLNAEGRDGGGRGVDFACSVPPYFRDANVR